MTNQYRSMNLNELIGSCRWLPLNTAERISCEAASIEMADRCESLAKALEALINAINLDIAKEHFSDEMRIAICDANISLMKKDGVEG